MKKTLTITLNSKLNFIKEKPFIVENTPANQKLKVRLKKQGDIYLSLEKARKGDFVHFTLGDNYRLQTKFREFREAEEMLQRYPKDDIALIQMEYLKKVYADDFKKYLKQKKIDAAFKQYELLIKKVQEQAVRQLVISQGLNPKLLKSINTRVLLRMR